MSGGFVNIGGDSRDMNYRYRMPVLVTKVEGRGNGIKTVVVNMVDIAKALHIHPAYPTKFFGIELGAQSKYNVSTERAIVNGCHQAGDLSKILNRFIEQFILCPNCKLPELKTLIKSASIKIECAACGHASQIKSAHRLVGYMTKNPPKSFEEGKGDKDDDKDKKKGKKSKGDKAAGEEGLDEEAASVVAAASAGGDGASAAPAAASVKSLVAEGDDSDASDSDSDDGGDGDEWHTDTSKAAQKTRADAEFKEMLAGTRKDVENIVLSAKADNKVDAPVTVLKIFLASKPRSPQEIAAELRRLAMARGLDEPQKMKILLEAIIDINQGPKAVADQFRAKADLLKHFTAQSSAAVAESAGGRGAANMLLTCIEDLIGVVERKLLPAAPVILQALYEEEVLEEATLLAWFDAPPEASWLVNKDVAAEVRTKAKPFIDWLREAEEEDDE